MLCSARIRHCSKSAVSGSSLLAYRYCLSTCDAILCVPHTLPSAFESGQEARIVQIDFSASFN